jgi:hypothetical protein
MYRATVKLVMLLLFRYISTLHAVRVGADGGPRIGGMAYHLDAGEFVALGFAVEEGDHSLGTVLDPPPVVTGCVEVLARYAVALVIGTLANAGSEAYPILAAPLARRDDVFLSLAGDPLEGSALIAVEG